VRQQQRNTLDAAEAGNELGRRMVSVGNWSRLQQAQVQLAQASAQMNLRRAQQAAMQTEATLIKTLGLTGVHSAVTLPDRLPDLPAQPLPAQVLDERATAIAAQLPRAEGMRNGAHVRLARQAYLTSHALALSSRDEVLKLREFITEETVLHYNGMLKSVWDLLAEVSSQSQAVASAIEAQRDFWIAETDLQWVLQGGEPDSFVSLGGGGGEPAAAAGH
jgi:outer membrane protein TolC